MVSLLTKDLFKLMHELECGGAAVTDEIQGDAEHLEIAREASDRNIEPDKRNRESPQYKRYVFIAGEKTLDNIRRYLEERENTRERIAELERYGITKLPYDGRRNMYQTREHYDRTAPKVLIDRIRLAKQDEEERIRLLEIAEGENDGPRIAELTLRVRELQLPPNLGTLLNRSFSVGKKGTRQGFSEKDYMEETGLLRTLNLVAAGNGQLFMRAHGGPLILPTGRQNIFHTNPEQISFLLGLYDLCERKTE